MKQHQPLFFRLHTTLVFSGIFLLHALSAANVQLQLASPESRLCNMQTCLVPQYICDREKPNYKLAGYVRSEAFYDMREVVASRESHFELYPKRRFVDNAKDIFDVPASNMTVVQTRIRGELNGPSMSTWQTYGAIEGDFLGATDLTTQDFHLRHGFIAFNNTTNMEWLLGQYWHPMTPPDCFPDTVAFNNGLPTDTQGRNAQVRCTVFDDRLQFIGAALWQTIGFQSYGPDGASGIYLRRSVLPELHAQMRIRKGDQHLFGLGVDYKRIVPRVVNDFGETVFETTNGVSAIAYYTGNFERVTLFAKLVYGQNIPDLVTIGGYGVRSLDTMTDHRRYTPFQTLHSWIFISGTRCDYTPGLFAGVVKNLGTLDNLYVGPDGNVITYGRDPDISYVWRVAPHLRINYKAIQFAGELEWTTAAYGTLGASGKPRCNVPVSNIRALLVAIYFF